MKSWLVLGLAVIVAAGAGAAASVYVTSQRVAATPPPHVRVASPATPPAASARRSGTPATAATSSTGGTVSPVAPSTSTASAGQVSPPAESGGPPGAVRRYFAALASGDVPAAYALLAPAWQAAHAYPAFAAAVKGHAVHLTSATIASAANFNATVKVRLSAVGGAAKTLSVDLVNLNAGPGATDAAVWRLSAPPPLP